MLVGWAARRYGWRWGMWAPGAVGFTVGILLLLGVRDSPVSVGYKPVEPVEKAKKVRHGSEFSSMYATADDLIAFHKYIVIL